MHVCVYTYNIHNTHTYIMYTKTFIWDVINRYPRLQIT